MKETLTFPAWDIPDVKPKRVSPSVFHWWVTHNIAWMGENRLLKRVVNQSCRQPVEARFVLK